MVKIAGKSAVIPLSTKDLNEFAAATTLDFATRVKYVKFAKITQIMCAIILCLMTIGEPNTYTVWKYVAAGLICIAGSIAGVYGAVKYLRAFLFFSFTMDIWTLGTITALMQAALGEAAAASNVSAASSDVGLGITTTATETASEEQGAGLLYLRALVSAILMFLTVAAGYMVYRFDQVLQEEGKEKEMDGSEITDEERQALIKKLSLVLKIVTITQFVSSMVTLAGLGDAATDVKFATDLLVGGVGVFGAIIGFVGAVQESRGCLMFFSIGELWAMAAITAYFHIALQSGDENAIKCKLAGGKGPYCDPDLVGGSVKIGTGLFLLVTNMVGANLSIRLSENLQDAEENGLDGLQYVGVKMEEEEKEEKGDPAAEGEAKVDSPTAALKKSKSMIEDAALGALDGKLDLGEMRSGTKILCWAQFIVTIVSTAGGAALSTTSAGVAAGVITGIIGCLTALIGLYGMKNNDRGALCFFYTVEQWGMAGLTSFIQQRVDRNSSNNLYCSSLVPSSVQANPECGAEDFLTKSSIGINMGLVGISLFAAYFALRLVEKLQDDGVVSGAEKVETDKKK